MRSRAVRIAGQTVIAIFLIAMTVALFATI